MFDWVLKVPLKLTVHDIKIAGKIIYLLDC